MTTPIDARRLRDGAQALALAEPSTVEEIRAAIATTGAAIAAMQSLDDLGSDLANDAAWQDMLRLQARYEKLRARLAAL